jgi:Mg2+/Co2+ transporter CorC
MEIKDLINQPEGEGSSSQKESPLKSLESDLKLYNESIREIATEIMVEGLSEYPIFIAHQHQVSVGELILDKDELNTQWSIQASMLEEFVDKGIIVQDKKDRFIKQFKNPNEHMCLFVVVPEGANFVFYPYI